MLPSRQVDTAVMGHTFNSARFSELAGDAVQLASRTADHEQRLASLVNALEPDRFEDLAALRELWAGARRQREIAEAIRAHLIGASAVASGDDARRPLVLIVDDSADNRDMAAMLLETSGFHTITAGNGLDGVIVAHYTRPALVIMDVAMPVLDGVQATRLLKASQATQDIKVIAYTAKMNVEEEAREERLFAEVLQKPASPQMIVEIAQRLALRGEPEVA
jgi:two-component system cell cycle response regulator DivK